MKENEQGQLVHQILKTQKELNESVINEVAQNKHLEIVSVITHSNPSTDVFPQI